MAEALPITKRRAGKTGDVHEPSFSPMISIEPPSSGEMDELMSGLSTVGLTRFLNRARAAVGVAGQVDVLLAGDKALRRLNRQFRGKNKATDVLSFPALGAEEGGDARLAGDIAISLETAGRQAAAFGHSLRDEVKVLLVHGLLHLHGLDHETDDGEMAGREAELRGALGLPGGLIERVAGGDVRDKSASKAKDNGNDRRGSRSGKAEATMRESAKARANAGVRPLRPASAGMTTPLGEVEGKAEARGTRTAAGRVGL